ncbi:MAG: DUF4163 domain-containing protein [Saprospirales bacterium]|nr:DUF4163 domain-containing protein [Saprospirales bacterium]
MKSPALAALFLAAIALISCQNNSAKGQQSTGLNFSTATLERQDGPGCDTEGGACVRLEMVYPLADEAKGPLAARINDSIRHAMSQVLITLNPEESDSKNLEQLADQFVASYKSFLAEAPDYVLGWSIEMGHEIHLNSPKIASIELMISSFTGGAHPVGYSNTFNFLLPSGELLLLDKMMTNRAGFMQLAEKEFKLTRGLPETANLQEEGYFFGEPFSLPSNFVFTSEGLYMIYNVYEAGAYALGPTEYLIPYEKLEGLLNLDNIL